MQPDDRSNSKSTSISDNSDSVSSTIKSDSNPVIPLTKVVQSNAASRFEKNIETDKNGLAIQHLIEPIKQQSNIYKFTPTERNSKTKHSNINRKLDSQPPSICESKHQNFTNPDVSNETLTHKYVSTSPNKITSQCQSKTLSLITCNLANKQIVTNYRNSSKVAKITFCPSDKNIMTSSKRVNFDISKTAAIKSSRSGKLINHSLTERNADVKSKCKSIVFNGTFPIDMPFESRFGVVPDAINDSKINTKLSKTFDEYEEDDIGFSSDDEECSGANNGWTMEELYNDPSIPLNYKKMCSDVESSITNFEKFLDSKHLFKDKEVRTFDIDGIILEEKKHI